MKVPKFLKNKTLRFRLEPLNPIPFIGITIERKGKTKLPKNWWKTRKGWMKEMFD
jgi:hypothetical protein